MVKAQSHTHAAGWRLLVLVGAALTFQMTGRYHADALVLGRDFYLSWLILRIVLPVAVLLLLGVPLKRVGLGLPRVDRNTLLVMIFGTAFLLIVFIGIYSMQGYFDYYSGAFQSGGRAGRFAQFLVFTSSTLTGWEFLHRGFLLFGALYILTEHEEIPGPVAAGIAVCLVWAFEVLFHFIKPEVEAAGMLIGSPLLSWLALRTRSIWMPFLMHFMVELLFILSLIMR
jgi:membrane protease YdiL (CAAX protease family)